MISPVISIPASEIHIGNLVASGKETSYFLWAVFPRWEKAY